MKDKGTHSEPILDYEIPRTKLLIRQSKERHSLLVLDEEAADEVLGLVGHVGEGFLVEVPVAGLDVLEGLDVVLSGEGREAAEEHVGEDADGPHVGVEADGLALHDLRRRELRRACRDLDDLVGVQLGGQAEVDQLDVGRRPGLAHDVLGLDVCGRQGGG